MDIIKRINDLLAVKDWSIHQLSLECDVPRSTLYRIMAHELSLTFAQIEKICDGFDITVCNFFNDVAAPEGDEALLIDAYRKLNGYSKKVIIVIINNMKQK